MTQNITSANSDLLAKISAKSRNIDPVDSDIPIGAAPPTAPQKSAAAPAMAAPAANESAAPADKSSDANVAGENDARTVSTDTPESKIALTKRVKIAAIIEADARLRQIVANATKNGIPSDDIATMLATANAAMESAKTLAEKDVEEVVKKADAFLSYVAGIEDYVVSQAELARENERPRVEVSFDDAPAVSTARNSAKTNDAHLLYENAVRTLETEAYLPPIAPVDKAADKPAKDAAAKDSNAPDAKKKDGTNINISIPSFGIPSLSKNVSSAIAAAATMAARGYISRKPEIHLERADAAIRKLASVVEDAHRGPLGRAVSNFESAAEKNKMNAEAYRRHLHARAKNEGGLDVEKLMPSMDLPARKQAEQLRVSIDRAMAETAKMMTSAARAGRDEAEIRRLSDLALRRTEQINAIVGNLPINNRFDPAKDYLQKRMEKLMAAIQRLIERVANYFGVAAPAAPGATGTSIALRT